jgi:amino acid transporter
MDEFDHPFDRAGEDLAPFTILSYLIAFTLCLATCLLSLSEMSQIGPDVGAIVTFDPREGPKHWDQPGIGAGFAAAAVPGRDCVLMPSVISAGGGSFVIEAKQTSLPPVFQVHWSGLRTDIGAGNCGRSADLTLTLAQVRALATVAGGYGVEHGFFGR